MTPAFEIKPLPRLYRVVLRAMGSPPYEVNEEHYRGQSERIERIRAEAPELARLFERDQCMSRDLDRRIRNMDISLARSYLALWVVILVATVGSFISKMRGLDEGECFDSWNRKFSSTAYKLVPKDMCP